MLKIFICITDRKL